jgi:hypothetical protein
VVPLPGDAELPAAVAQDRGADSHWLVQVNQPPALLHMQLHKQAQLLEGLVIGADEPGILPVRGSDVGIGVAVRVLEPAGLVRVQFTGQQPGTQAGDAEPRALLLGKNSDGQRPAGAEPAGLQDIDGDQRRSDTQRTVVRAAARNGIEVAAGRNSVPPRACGGVPPCPDDAVVVCMDVEAAPFRLLNEPAPQVRFRGGENRPRIATPRCILADGGDVLQQAGNSGCAGSGRRQGIRRGYCLWKAHWDPF